MLTAFSMASMIHIKNGTNRKIDPEVFNEAWLMHTTTSPFYPMVASLDVASNMMAISGKKIVDGMLEEAIYFRKRMIALAGSGEKKHSWWFGIWQPRGIEKLDDSVLMSDPSVWTLKPKDKWHGFDITEDDNILLDPIKVTVLTPGISESGAMLDEGIPAPVVARFLMDDLIVPEKTGFYNLLFLFSPGVSSEKSDRLIKGFLKFRELYESNASIKKIFPELVKEYPGRYEKMGLKDLCLKMHKFLKDRLILSLMEKTYLVIPSQNMLPADAYKSIVRGNAEYIGLKELKGRTSAVILAPYPPGIPIVMPGEEFTDATQKIVDYFSMVQELDNVFPGFEIEVHGMKVDTIDGKNVYKVLCVK
jgi:lysine decarboxylase/arginine decarboxylase